MKYKLHVVTGLVMVASMQLQANDFEEKLLENNRSIEEMSLTDQKLKLQASMAKSYKDMAESGFIVDADGNPRGIGDMELLAIEVRRKSQNQANSPAFDENDPFGGLDPIIPMGSSGFTPFDSPPQKEPEPAAPVVQQVEVVSKPTEEEKRKGKQLLSLVEIRDNSVVVFTNDGFQEIRIGDKVYDLTLRSIKHDEVSLSGKNGNRILRIDWTRSVRYTDD